MTRIHKDKAGNVLRTEPGTQPRSRAAAKPAKPAKATPAAATTDAKASPKKDKQS